MMGLVMVFGSRLSVITTRFLVGPIVALQMATMVRMSMTREPTLARTSMRGMDVDALAAVGAPDAINATDAIDTVNAVTSMRGMDIIDALASMRGTDAIDAKIGVAGVIVVFAFI